MRLSYVLPLPLLALVLYAVPPLLGCQGNVGNAVQGDGGGSLPALQSLAISPQNPALTVSLGAAQTLAFTVTGTFADGETRDVTAEVHLGLLDLRLGSFNGGTLTTTGEVGGKTLVEARSGEISAQTELVVTVQHQHEAPGLPADAASLFAQAESCAGASPTLSYPEDGTLVPPNLSEMAVMWRDPGHDLWQLTISSPATELTVLTAEPRFSLTAELWRLISASNLEGEVALQVRGLSQSAPAECGESAAVALRFGADPVQGAIYYWNATSGGGIIRYDFGQPNQQAEALYTAEHAADCVACHALSRDGRRMALTFTGGDGPAGILDVESRTLTADRTYHANFQVFTPDSTRLIGSSAGVLTVRDPVDGSARATLETGGKATMPDVSPDGGTLVFVRPDQHRLDWSFSGGSIVSAPLQGEALGAATVLVQSSAGQNNYYPAFSPDGQWLIFNRSTGDSYSDDDASLLIIPAAGGEPLALARANQGAELRNSWARWSPFEQTYRGEKLLWFTFSSTRDYGSALVNGDKPSEQRNPQIWMAAFSPARAAAGEDPSYPAFRLPFQDLATNNHIAQWTEQAIAIE